MIEYNPWRDHDGKCVPSRITNNERIMYRRKYRDGMIGELTNYRRPGDYNNWVWNEESPFIDDIVEYQYFSDKQVCKISVELFDEYQEEWIESKEYQSVLVHDYPELIVDVVESLNKQLISALIERKYNTISIYQMNLEKSQEKLKVIESLTEKQAGVFGLAGNKVDVIRKIEQSMKNIFDAEKEIERMSQPNFRPDVRWNVEYAGITELKDIKPYGK